MDDHDTSYRLLFSHAEMVRDLLTGFVPESWIAELDLNSLEKMNGSYVSDDCAAATMTPSGEYGGDKSGFIFTCSWNSSLRLMGSCRCAS